MKLINPIREIRTDNPGWFAKKIRVILSWEMEGQYISSVVTIDRIIKNTICSIVQTYKCAQNGGKRSEKRQAARENRTI